ncbi:hypothetical protein V1477_004446 [Vespula maculifrons]|uniref:Uncharacterized protein n=1 Tax=Vespula maculifrons TaxID=7453 RepID=A0ABD2CSK0_VESMC
MDLDPGLLRVNGSIGSGGSEEGRYSVGSVGGGGGDGDGSGDGNGGGDGGGGGADDDDEEEAVGDDDDDVVVVVVLVLVRDTVDRDDSSYQNLKELYINTRLRRTHVHYRHDMPTVFKVQT